MNRTTLLNWVLPIAILLGAAAPHSHAATLTGQVVKVADGDTVTVLAQNGTRYRVRFLGIDRRSVRTHVRTSTVWCTGSRSRSTITATTAMAGS